MKPVSIDTDELRSAVESGRTLTSIANELGVSPATVSRAAKRAGIAVPRRPPPITRRRPHPQLDDPDWIAEIGIFIQDTPVISRRDLQAAIDKRQSIEDIRRQHHVTARTVAVELRRHGLLVAHKKRHLR